MRVVWMGLALAVAAAGVVRPAWTQEAGDSDLDRIPAAALSAVPQAKSTSTFEASTYVEAAPEYLQNRASFVVPLPGRAGPDWVSRLFVDSRGEWKESADLRFDYSVRAEFYAQDEGPFFTTHSTGLSTLNYQFREGYLSWSPDPDHVWFIDVGRINVRTGAAYAFNPTDFLRSMAVVDETSQDPADLRNDRLGTVMVRGQYFIAGSTVTAILAPKLCRSPVSLTEPLSAANPQVCRTNSAAREELALDHGLPGGISLQLLGLREGPDWTYGANLTAGLGAQTTAYAEWSGSRQHTLPVQAMNYALLTGTFRDAASPIPTTSAERVTQGLATGISYTNRDNINIIVEYDLSQLGLSDNDWRQWFDAGDGTLQDEKLWYLRAYAADQQYQADRQRLFVRVSKGNWLVHNLSLSAFCIIDLARDSSFSQVDLDYGITNRLGVELLLQAARGSRWSDFGSNPVEASYIVKASWYL